MPAILLHMIRSQLYPPGVCSCASFFAYSTEFDSSLALRIVPDILSGYHMNLRQRVRYALAPAHEDQAFCSSRLGVLPFDLLLNVSRDTNLHQRPIEDFRFGGVYTGEVCQVGRRTDVVDIYGPGIVEGGRSKHVAREWISMETVSTKMGNLWNKIYLQHD